MGVMRSRHVICLVTTLLALGCGAKSDKSAADARIDPIDDADVPHNDAPIDSIQEPCDGNVIGSASVVDGPGAGPGNDGSFRSLVVHPTNPDIVYIGSE